MSHPPEIDQNIPDLSGQRKTLFMVAGETVAKLVTRSERGMRATAKRFIDPRTALEWCLKHKVNFVCFINPGTGN